jgi:hypothetical protein
MSDEDIMADYYAHLAADNPDANLEEFEDDEFQEEVQKLLDDKDGWEEVT